MGVDHCSSEHKSLVVSASKWNQNIQDMHYILAASKTEDSNSGILQTLLSAMSLMENQPRAWIYDIKANYFHALGLHLYIRCFISIPKQPFLMGVWMGIDEPMLLNQKSQSVSLAICTNNIHVGLWHSILIFSHAWEGHTSYVLSNKRFYKYWYIIN